MWTYLALLLAAVALVFVFFKRAFLVWRGKRIIKRIEKTTRKDSSNGKESKKKSRLSKDQKLRVEALSERGAKLAEEGKEDEAIRLFVQALVIDELHMETQHRLAMLYMQKQMYSAAAALFKQMAEITGDAVYFSNLGLAYYKQSEFEKAAAAYQKSVEIDPKRPQRFVSLSQVYRSLNRLQNAAIALNKALELDKKNIDFLLLLSELQVELRDFSAAKKTLEHVLKLDNKNETAMVFLKKLKRNLER